MMGWASQVLPLTPVAALCAGLLMFSGVRR